MPTVLPPGLTPKVSPKKNAMVGRDFGKLHVVACVGYRRTCKEAWFECECECGAVVYLSRSSLANNDIERGCETCKPRRVGSRHYKWKGYGEIGAQFWASVRLHAERREIPFRVTIEQAWELFLAQGRRCAMTGVPLEFGRTSRDRGTASLDRKDSTGDYSLPNLQWVHAKVNMMKRAMTDADFVAWCKAVAAHSG